MMLFRLTIYYLVEYNPVLEKTVSGKTAHCFDRDSVNNNRNGKSIPWLKR